MFLFVRMTIIQLSIVSIQSLITHSSFYFAFEAFEYEKKKKYNRNLTKRRKLSRDAQCSFKFKNCNLQWTFFTYSLEHVRLVEFILSFISLCWFTYLNRVCITSCTHLAVLRNQEPRQNNQNDDKNETKIWTECNSAIQSLRESQFQHLTSSEIIKICMNRNAQNEKEIKTQKWQKDRKRNINAIKLCV